MSVRLCPAPSGRARVGGSNTGRSPSGSGRSPAGHPNLGSRLGHSGGEDLLLLPVLTPRSRGRWSSVDTGERLPEEQLSPLARPHDLRHAAVSTWLNGGVEPTRVAEWAGHSVAVLLRVYAKCIAGQEATARHRVDLALGLH